MNHIDSDNINAGQTITYPLSFRAGITYQIYVRNALPGVDLDVYALDGNGQILAGDNSIASDAACTFTPGWSGEYIIAVTCAKGSTTYHLYLG